MAGLAEKSDIKCAIGLMSGTSMDGVDAAIIYTDGHKVERFGATITLEYPQEVRDRIRAGLDEAYNAVSAESPSPLILALEAEITDWHIKAVKQLLQEAKLEPADVDVIGFHGQTMTHRPDKGWTWQIGDGTKLANETGIAVVNDFRTADVANGGEGAPLVPLYHAALLASSSKHETVAILNIGGVANVTWISVSDDIPQIIAFDTGPGNAMLDDWAKIHTGNQCDIGGELAARGCAHEEVVVGLMSSPYFDEQPPKTLDRDDFNIQAIRGLNAEDGAATLTEFMVESVVAAQSHFKKPPEAWYICGGGRLNPTIMRRLRRRLPVLVDPVEVLGWRGDALEAEAFAFLAVRSVKELPLSLPETTGCSEPTCGGRLHTFNKKRSRK